MTDLQPPTRQVTLRQLLRTGALLGVGFALGWFTLVAIPDAWHALKPAICGSQEPAPSPHKTTT